MAVDMLRADSSSVWILKPCDSGCAACAHPLVTVSLEIHLSIGRGTESRCFVAFPAMSV
jgi:hypothetical protein